MKFLKKFDLWWIQFFRRHGDAFARVALFVIFFWFGILKVFLLSPAGPLVVDLLEVTFLSFIPPEKFLIGFGFFEMMLGIMALIPRLERFTFAFIGIHLCTTVLPLFLLPEVTWYQAFVPTLIGQYILKNLALAGLGLLLFARLKPMTVTNSVWGHVRKMR